MPVISTYSSSGSSYISSSASRYPKSSYSDRRYCSSYSSGLNASSSSSSGLYRKSSYRYDLPLTPSSASTAYRREERESSSAQRTVSGAGSAAGGVASSSSSSGNGTSSKSANSYSNTGSSGSSSHRYSSGYAGGYGTLGSSSPSRNYSYTRPSLSGSSNSYVSNLRNTALCGAELYQRYSLSTFKPAPSIVARAQAASAANGTTGTTSGIAALKGSSAIVSSLETGDSNKGSSSAGTSGGNKVLTVYDRHPSYRLAVTHHAPLALTVVG